MSSLLSLDATFCLHAALTLLHFLWQGLLLAAIACLAGWCLHRRSAVARYRIYAVTLLMMLACLPTTFVFLCQDEVRQTPDPVLNSQIPTKPSGVTQPVVVLAETPEATVAHDVPSSIGSEEATAATPMMNLPTDSLASVDPMAAPPPADTGAIVERLTRWATAAYLIGVALMFARMLLAFSGTQRLRRDAHRIHAESLAKSPRIPTVFPQIIASPPRTKSGKPSSPCRRRCRRQTSLSKPTPTGEISRWHTPRTTQFPSR